MLIRVEDKKEYFNRYWQTRDLPSADARSVQRAGYVQKLLGDDRTTELLDVGCGRGTVMTFLAHQGYNIGGCDLASDSIASLHAEGYDVFLFDIEADDLPKSYDGILCLEVLQQVFDPVAALKKLARHLKHEGFMIVSVPNEFHIVSRLRLLFGRSHLGHFEESHIRLFSPARAREMFEQADLMIEESVTVSVLPPKYKNMRRLGGLIARLSPSLLSLSQIYKLKAK